MKKMDARGTPSPHFEHPKCGPARRFTEKEAVSLCCRILNKAELPEGME